MTKSQFFQEMNNLFASAGAFFYGSPERTRLTMVLVFTLMVLGISLMQHGASSNACYI